MKNMPMISLSWRSLIAVFLLYTIFLVGFSFGAQQVSANGIVAVIAPSSMAIPDEEQLLVVTAAATTTTTPTTAPEVSLEPQAVVYCTHTSEAYSGQIRQCGVAGGVLEAARTLAAELEANGIGTILLENIFDAPDWNLAYGNSLSALKNVKKKYPDIELFIDVHRDAEIEGVNTKLTNDSGSYARMMLIIGSDANLEHPQWQKNRDWAYKINAELEEIMPGIMRDPRIYKGRYNQHLGNKAILVEVGSNGNSVEDAKASAVLLAEALSNSF